MSRAYNMRLKQMCERNAGFTVLELAITLSVVGVIVMAAAAVYRPAIGAAQAQRHERLLEGIRSALITFAMTHHRLPCADVNGNGYEGSSGRCGTKGFEVGKVPYLTLGIALPGKPGTDAALANVIYGVYRNPAVADLAKSTERTGNFPMETVGFANMNDFLQGLAKASAAPFAGAFVYVGGLDASGKTTCANGENVAFVLASAGRSDADGDGSMFDGVNKTLAVMGGRCFSSPDQRTEAGYDDVAIAVGFNELAGALRAGLH